MVYTLQILPWEETTPTSSETEPSERLLSSVSFSCFLFSLLSRSSSATYHRGQLFSKYFPCIPCSTSSVFGRCLQLSKTPDFLFFTTERFYSGIMQNNSQIGFVWWFLMTRLVAALRKKTVGFHLSVSSQRYQEKHDLQAGVDTVREDRTAELRCSSFSTAMVLPFPFILAFSVLESLRNLGCAVT